MASVCKDHNIFLLLCSVRSNQRSSIISATVLPRFMTIEGGMYNKWSRTFLYTRVLCVIRSHVCSAVNLGVVSSLLQVEVEQNIVEYKSLCKCDTMQRMQGNNSVELHGH